MKVYTMEQWGKDGVLNLKRGQLVEYAVYQQLRDCVPPLVCLNSFFQCGEPYGSNELGEPTYLTMVKDGKDWKFVGYCTSYSQDVEPLSFHDLDFQDHPISKSGYIKGAKQAVMHFKNGYGISVLLGNWFYSNGIDTYEVAVLKDGNICRVTPITDDVLGFKTQNEVSEIMKKIQML